MRISSPLLSVLLLTAPLYAESDLASPPSEQAAHEKTAIEATLQQFWQAESTEQVEAAIDAALASGARFDQVFTRLEAGRSYSAEVATGRIDLVNRTSDRTRHHYRVLVPEDYDPRRRYRTVFYLHGGVSRPAWRKGGGWWSSYDQFESPDRISVFPSSWESSMWWHRRQAENLPAILNHLKRTYNLDENDTHLLGISDGATGAFFFAFRDPTPWASFLPFIGHPGVLASRRVGADGDMYPRNAFGKPFFVVNGGLDQLYPVARVLPHLDLLYRAGAEIEFRPKMEAGHDTSWWPEESERIHAFVDAHRRDPLPDRLAWETEHTDRYHRNHWLVIDELGTAAGESSLEDHNTLIPPATIGVRPDPESSGGVRIEKVNAGGVGKAAGLKPGDVVLEVAGQPTPTVEVFGRVLNEHGGWGSELTALVGRGEERIELTLRTPEEPPKHLVNEAFPRRAPSGHIEVAREGNRIEVRTQGVRRFRLLLSPLELDFEREIVVVTNGGESFRGRIEPSVETLLRWAARDQDRTMLFAAELPISLPEG